MIGAHKGPCGPLDGGRPVEEKDPLMAGEILPKGVKGLKPHGECRGKNKGIKKGMPPNPRRDIKLPMTEIRKVRIRNKSVLTTGCNWCLVCRP